MHPERRDLTVWEMFQTERPALIAMAQPFGWEESARAYRNIYGNVTRAAAP